MEKTWNFMKKFDETTSSQKVAVRQSDSWFLATGLSDS